MITTFSEVMRGVYRDDHIDRIRTAIVTGRSRGVRGLPGHLQPPIYDTPADAPWKVRVREWHADQRERDERQRHPFFRWIEGSQ